MLKVELHTHTADDPLDRIPYTTTQLIDRAAALGYDALAVTLHDHQLDVAPLASYAADRGLVLIPGIERTIDGRHVLLLNFARGADRVHSFADLAALKATDPAGLVVAPHPFFPGSYCLRGLMDVHADLFDAVEWSGMFTSTLNFNDRGERWAREHRKPMVGNGDVHRLVQLGPTCSLVDAEPNAAAICAAVKAGAVWVQTQPLSWLTAGSVFASLMLADAAGASPWLSALRPREAALQRAATL